MPGRSLWLHLKQWYLILRIRRAERTVKRLRSRLVQRREVQEIDVKAFEADCGRLYCDLDMKERRVPEQIWN